MTNTQGIDPKNPNWEPLEAAVRMAGLPLKTCSEFMWMFRSAAGEHYKHSDTRRYLILSVYAEFESNREAAAELRRVRSI